MGIYDRDYMRDPPPSRVLPNLFWLGLALAIGLICIAIGYRFLYPEAFEGNPVQPREKVKFKGKRHVAQDGGGRFQVRALLHSIAVQQSNVIMAGTGNAMDQHHLGPTARRQRRARRRA